MLNSYVDEPPHQILSDTLLFSLFHYSLYIADPPLHTPTPIQPHTITLTLTYLMDTCFNSFLSSPNVHPPTVQPIMNPCITQSGTYYSFASDEPYAHFLVDHLYLTYLYLPFDTENSPHKFPPEFRLSDYTSHCIALTLHQVTLHCTALKSHCLYSLHHTWRQSLPPRLHPQSPIGFIHRSLAP